MNRNFLYWFFYILLPCVQACTISSYTKPFTKIVTISQHEKLTILPSGQAEVEYDNTLELKVTVAEYYKLITDVSGTCPKGTWQENTYFTGNITEDCSVHFDTEQEEVEVTISVDSQTTSSPSTSKTFAKGSTGSFEITSATQYSKNLTVGGTCPAGSWSGDTYSTGKLLENCSVSFSSSLVGYWVTPSSTNVTITPSSTQTVTPNATQSFTVTAPTGYTLSSSVGGTCPTGSWSGAVYTTGAITANCTVSFSSTINTHTITPSVDANTTSNPSTVQTVNYGSTKAFTITAATGYQLNSAVGGTCPAGSWSGAIYTTGAITANCTVSFTSSLIPNTCTCPATYTMDASGLFCRKVNSTSAPGAFINVVAGSNNAGAYGPQGAYGFDFNQTSAYPYTTGGPAITDSNATSIVRITGISAEFWKSRLNTVGIVPQGQINQKQYSIGICLNVPSTSEYVMGIAADNGVAFSLGGKQIFLSSLGASDGNAFAFWWLGKMKLNAGNNPINFVTTNDGGDASFGFEYYQNTMEQVKAATAITDLTVFSKSSDYLGQTKFAEDGTTCPAGAYYDACDNLCKSISTTACE